MLSTDFAIILVLNVENHILEARKHVMLLEILTQMSSYVLLALPVLVMNVKPMERSIYNTNASFVVKQLVGIAGELPIFAMIVISKHQ